MHLSSQQPSASNTEGVLARAGQVPKDAPLMPHAAKETGGSAERNAKVCLSLFGMSMLIDH